MPIAEISTAPGVDRATGGLGRSRAVLAIDQGTTNSKAILVDADGQVLASGSAPVALSLPQPGWAEQDADQIWSSVVQAISDCLAAAPGVAVAGLALSTQRESVVCWRRSTGRPIAPLIGWQDVRTADWTATLPAAADLVVRQRTGLQIDAMFSAPKIRWLLDALGDEIPVADLAVGTVDSWLLWKLTGGREHLVEVGNASRTLLFDVVDLDWSEELLAIFSVPRAVLGDIAASDGGFGATSGVPGIGDGTPIISVLADSHAALYGQGCTEVGSAKATYGTGTSVMVPVDSFVGGGSPVPYTLAWLTTWTSQRPGPAYAREGNILASGSTLAWTAQLLGLPDVATLMDRAATVPDAAGVLLLPAFSGLGAPHWDRGVRASLSEMSNATTPAHVARAAVDAVAQQVCDITEVIERDGIRLDVLRVDGGATVSSLLMQTQADLLGCRVEVADVAEVSALGAAQLGWEALGVRTGWAEKRQPARVYLPQGDDVLRVQARDVWRKHVAGARAR